MPRLSISQLAAFTGKDRRTVADRLQGLDYQEGPDRAHLYEAEDAFAAIYLEDAKVGPVDQAKIEQATQTAALSRVRREELERKRIPIEIFRTLLDGALQAFTTTLKSARGRKLTTALINELLEKLRTVKIPVTW